MIRGRFIALATTTALALVAALITSPPTQSAFATGIDLECGDALINKTLKNGASWRMCARVHPIKGLVLEKVEFRPASGDHEYVGYKRVLDQIYLALLNVPYDNGNAYYNDVPAYGFGNEYLLEQTPKVCLGETRNVRQSYVYRQQLIERDMPGICLDEVPTGLTTHAQPEALTNDTSKNYVTHGTGFEVSTLSKISWYEYQQKLTFDDHGGIDVALGATGDLAPGAPGSPFFDTNPQTGWPIGPPIAGQDYFSASHSHNAVYRVDFGIDQAARQEVEQWDYSSEQQIQGPVVNGTRTTKVKAFNSIPGRDPGDAPAEHHYPGADQFEFQYHNELTWWRVLNPDSINRDGHARSYEIVNQNINDRFLGVTSPSVSFTNNHACQEYATANLNAECPNQGVLNYVAHETEPLTDPVAWVNVGFHHIVRDEDQSPMPVHWQRFQLVPRDFFAQSPNVTMQRICVNGPPEGQMGSGDSCIATNRVRPRITADTPGVQPGTTLTATTGTWATAGVGWNYAYLWFRDGQPITDNDQPATSSTYVVTPDDRGHAISVKVTASQTGYGTGIAESLATAVPGAPTPSPSRSTTTTPPKPKPATSKVSARLLRSKVTTRQNARVKILVTAAGQSASGRIRIRHGAKTIRTATVKNGKTTLKLPKLRKAGTYRLRVEYLGAPHIKPSKSRFFTLKVAR